jgi:hypothetical protein
MNTIGQTSARVTSILATASAQTWRMAGAPLPATLWVRPGAGETLTISYSTDGGTNYQSLTALTGAAAYTETQVSAGFTNLKITSAPGTTAGTWGVC